MRIAILGTRGIPANYGGFETFAEELASRLTERGHEVTVYGRSHHVPPGLSDYRGVKLVVLPTIRHKYLDTVIHTWLATLHATKAGYDVLLLCNVANASCLVVPRLFGIPAAINVDGLEWKRKKWNWLGRSFYRLSEHLACRLSRYLVTDARTIQDYYRVRHGRDTYFIAYGADTESRRAQGGRESASALEPLGLEPRKYFLYVGRLEPENNADGVIDAFHDVDTELRLVIVGDAPYATDYVTGLKNSGDGRVVFAGYVFGDRYKELVSQAYCQIQAAEVGGTHPALIEAMAWGNGVLVHDVEENREVAGDDAWYFKFGDGDGLTRQMRRALAEPETLAALASRARVRVARLYQWDAVTTAYENLFATMVEHYRERSSKG